MAIVMFRSGRSGRSATDDQKICNLVSKRHCRVSLLRGHVAEVPVLGLLPVRTSVVPREPPVDIHVDPVAIRALATTPGLS